MPTLGEIFVGDNEVYFISSEAGKLGGYVTRISIAPEPSSLLLLLMASTLFVCPTRRRGSTSSIIAPVQKALR